jgi:beta-glucanase (GH16 family)
MSFNINGDQPNQVSSVLHYVESNKIKADVRQYNSGDFVNEFRTYKINWDPNEIVWSVDGAQVFRVVDQNKIPNADLYLELMVNVGGSYLDIGNPDASTKLPCYLAVDYISISQWK